MGRLHRSHLALGLGAVWSSRCRPLVASWCWAQKQVECQQEESKKTLAVTTGENRNDILTCLFLPSRLNFSRLKSSKHKEIAFRNPHIEVLTECFACVNINEVTFILIMHLHLCELTLPSLLTQVVSAVEYCHRMSVAHRDLKPENLLLSAKGEIKLADFGLSAQFTPGTPLTTYCGTPYYVAPEIVRRKPYHGPSADVWSLGVLLYMFVTGTLPFKGDNLKEVMRQIKGGKYDIPSCVSRQCQKLLRGLLVINPLGRSSVQKIMEDKWLNMGHREPLVPYREVKRNMNDEKCIETLRQMGYQEQDIEESLKHQRPNEISATYNFLLQKSVENNTGPGGTRVGRQHSMDSNPAPPAAAETNNDSVTTASQPNSRPPASWHGFTLQAQEHRTAMCNDRPAIRSLPVRGKSLVKSTSGGSDIISKLRTKLRRSPAPSGKIPTTVATSGAHVPSSLDLNATFHGQHGEQPNHSPPASPSPLRSTTSRPTQSPGFFRKILARFRMRTLPQEKRQAPSDTIPSGSPPGDVPFAGHTSIDTAAHGQPQGLPPAPPDSPPASLVPSRHSAPSPPAVPARRSIFSRLCCCTASD
ncbi:MAP/microtubule affinity-regulating kinase 4-like [Eulemur rufifrons]|uniref:MAP/microtubule affinity-regulating kinase 4-like n=1 Tax=Eulemur rufifrons TaxID=859984 RepID=UPI003742ECA0